MAQQQKGLEKLQEALRDHVLVHLQSPLVLRIVVISLIGMVGIGGMGTPLYFKLQTLYEKYYEQQVRVVLIKEHQDVKLIFAEYKQRLSPNTEFIEWVRDIRDACRQGDLTILGLQPTLVGSKDPDAVRQLTIELTVTGTYLNIIRVLGRFEYSKVRINVREIKMAPSSPGNFLVRIKLGILMQPPSAKKNVKEKVAVAQTAVAVSSASVSSAVVTNISTAAAPSATSAVAPAVSTAPAPSPKPTATPAPPQPPIKEPSASSATAAGTPQLPKPPQTPPALQQLPPPSSKFSTEASMTGTKANSAPSSKFATQSQTQTAAPSSKFAPPELAPQPPKRKKTPRTVAPTAKAPVIQPKANPEQALEGDGGLLPE